MSASLLRRLPAAGALAALALLAGCAKDAADLAPFPCATDLGCPEGTLCLPGSGSAVSNCVVPQAEALCKADAQCAGFARETVCDLGRCRATCADGAGCGAGEQCSAGAGKGKGVCLKACPGGACPGALECGETLPGAGQVCIPKGSKAGSACTGAAGTNCGPAGSGLQCTDLGTCELKCADGAGCGTGQVCSAKTGAGICMQDCVANPACPAGTACAPLWYQSRKACQPIGAGLESTCSPEGARCGPPGSASVCSGHRCLSVCKAGSAADCPTGEVCSNATGDGVCVKVCTPGSTGCPGDFVCSGPFADSQSRCVPKELELGGACSGGEGTPCGLPGQLGSCRDGVCVAQTCNAGIGCVSGSFCTSTTGPGACLVDCTGNPACPADLSCKLWFDGAHKACVHAGAGIGGACTTEGAACGANGAGTCTSSRCLPKCNPSTSTNCPSGTISWSCTSTSGPGVCLAECTTSGACPSGLTCGGKDRNGRRQCTPPGAGIGDACTGTGACGLAVLGATCSQGICAVPCSNALPCSGGAGVSVCSSSTASAGVCLDVCSSDATCAPGLKCKTWFDGTTKVCTADAAALDAACATDGAACGPAGAQAVCAGGACVPFCSSGACSLAGRVCTKGAGGPAGVVAGCVTDCTGGAACTAPLTCQGLWHDGKSGCVARALPACAGPTAASQCSLCGNRDAWNVACGNGIFCPDNSTCNGTTSCTCNAGFTAMNCSNQTCGGSVTCTYPNYWCKPNTTPTQITCTGVPGGLTGSCACADGRTVAVACGTGASSTCEFLCSVGCDPALQTCPTGAKNRCQVVSDTGKLLPECILPPSVPLAQDALCNVTDDQCGAGLACTDLGTLHAQPKCEPYCSATKACAAGSTQCLRTSTSSPGFGLCVAGLPCSKGSCAAGTTCMGGFQLPNATQTSTCRPVGAKAELATCGSTYECAADLACATTASSPSQAVCTKTCSSNAECTGGLTCQSYGIPNAPTFGRCR